MKLKAVTFLGSARVLPSDRVYQAAFETAKLLAQNGYEIIDGGGPGVMKAATQGGKLGGAKVTGVTFYPTDMELFEARDITNKIDVEIKQENYLQRTLKLLETGQVFLIFKGGTGTVSEFGMAWGLAKLYFGHHKPLILYGDFWYEIIEAFAKNMMIREEELKVYTIVNNPDAVLAAIHRIEKKIDEEEGIKGPFRL